MKQLLPLGIQFFPKIRERGFVYVDKTARIHELIIGSGRAVCVAVLFLLVLTAVPARSMAGEGVSNVNDGSNVYDLYIMSSCPHGILALGELAEVIRAFPQNEWNVWFVGTAHGDKLASLRGEDDIFDKTLWLGVQALYPFRYHEFLFMRASSPVSASTEKLLDEMDFDVRKIRRWAEDMGSSELRRHYLRSMQLNINRSPTLLINNNVYDKPIGGGRLVQRACQAVEQKPSTCDDYPECFEDDDCTAKRKIGRCVKDEKTERQVCEFRDDASFVLTVLVADSALNSPELPVIETVDEFLPGMQVKIVKLSSDEGKRLVAKHSPATLPYLHFESDVIKTHRYARVSEMLTEADGGFTLKKGIIKENYFPLREEKRGLIELYVDPLMPGVGKIINVFLVNPELAGRVALRPVVTGNLKDGKLSTQDRLRSEEALRWLVLADEYPKRYLPYLKRYSEDPGSSFWFKWLKGLGINKKKFLRRLEANRPKIIAYSEDFAPISSGEPVIILINNRAKTAIANEGELVRVLKSMGYLKN